MAAPHHDEEGQRGFGGDGADHQGVGDSDGAGKEYESKPWEEKSSAGRVTTGTTVSSMDLKQEMLCLCLSHLAHHLPASALFREGSSSHAPELGRLAAKLADSIPTGKEVAALLLLWLGTQPPLLHSATHLLAPAHEEREGSESAQTTPGADCGNMQADLQQHLTEDTCASTAAAVKPLALFLHRYLVGQDAGGFEQELRDVAMTFAPLLFGAAACAQGDVQHLRAQQLTALLACHAPSLFPEPPSEHHHQHHCHHSAHAGCPPRSPHVATSSDHHSHHHSHIGITEHAQDHPSPLDLPSSCSSASSSPAASSCDEGEGAPSCESLDTEGGYDSLWQADPEVQGTLQGLVGGAVTCALFGDAEEAEGGEAGATAEGATTAAATGVMAGEEQGSAQRSITSTRSSGVSSLSTSSSSSSSSSVSGNSTRTAAATVAATIAASVPAALRVRPPALLLPDTENEGKDVCVVNARVSLVRATAGAGAGKAEPTTVAPLASAGGAPSSHRAQRHSHSTSIDVDCLSPRGWERRLQGCRPLGGGACGTSAAAEWGGPFPRSFSAPVLLPTGALCS